MWKKKITNPFDSYMLNRVRRLKDVWARSAEGGDLCYNTLVLQKGHM